MAQGQAVAARVTVLGVVQGVGFRPFVAWLAREHGVTGSVWNEQGHVVIDVYGAQGAVDAFVRDIEARKPPASDIRRIERRALPAPDAPPAGFSIAESGDAGDGPVMPCPDLAVCDACVAEMHTPGDPRFQNPFISCTHCGPRFSVMRGVPYDRENTAMDRFPMCPLCGRQYRDPSDRRYHAQTVCCNACGPKLFYHSGERVSEGGRALDGAVEALSGGGIVAVKGIGGYHLACSPYDDRAVAALRAAKGREHKPFAVMFPDMASVRAHCAVSDEEEALLKSAPRPIVLLFKGKKVVAPGVCGTSAFLGAFLPYTPLQHLMLRRGGPLVMTSANATAAPLIIEDEAMLRFSREHPEVRGVLFHDREILRRLDDSVAAVDLGRPRVIRRARGYVPSALPVPFCGSLLAYGAQEKNTVCLCRDGYAYLSTEIGDLDSLETECVFERTIEDMQSLLRIAPVVSVCDMHPGYLSAWHAGRAARPCVKAQHHHAHIVSVIAEHALEGPVIGVAFDGTGYGTDGTVWGGEFLVVTGQGFARAGHLKPVKFLGGDESVRQGWKSALCAAFDAGLPPSGDPREAVVRAALQSGVHTILSSSMGRMFDAVSAMLGVCAVSAYDGQCAIELENAAWRAAARGGAAAEPLAYALSEGSAAVLDLAPCFREIDALLRRGADADALAWRFHETVARAIVGVCESIAKRQGVRTVALSGGVFQNRLLLGRVVPLLRVAGFDVYWNERVPSGDGGVSLGQALIGLISLEKGGSA